MDSDLYKKAIFEEELTEVIEKKHLAADVSTLMKTTAKNVFSPIMTLTEAKNSTKECVNAIGTTNITKDELVVDRKVSNSVKFCEKELETFDFDGVGLYRKKVYKSIVAKKNKNWFSDIFTAATSGGADIDLSDDEKIRKLLLEIKRMAQDVDVKPKVDGATITEALLAGKPFMAVGDVVFAAIDNSVATTVSVFSDEAIKGKFIDTPYGVRVINFENAATDPKDIIYGVAGIPLSAYRGDMLSTSVKEINAITTAAAADDEIAANDEILEMTHIVTAGVIEKNGLIGEGKDLVLKRKMT